MSLISDLRALLRRPIAQSAPPGAHSSRRKQTAAAECATEQEYLDALAQLDAEWDAARQLLEAAGAERERLLVAGDDYAEIRHLAEQIDEAQFRLEAAERIRPDLFRGLNRIRFANRCERWLVVRDAAAAAAEAQLAAIQAYEAALAAWRVTYDEVIAEYPEAAEITPRMPGLYSPMAFEKQIANFRTRILERGAPPPPLMISLAAAVEHSVRTGDIPPNLPSDWRLECERALSGDCKIVLNSRIIDRDGRTLEKGTVLTLPYADAAAHVSAGRACYV